MQPCGPRCICTCLVVKTRLPESFLARKKETIHAGWNIKVVDGTGGLLDGRSAA